MNTTAKVKVQTGSLLVPQGKSKRLAAMREKVRGSEQRTADCATPHERPTVKPGHELEAALNEARMRMQRQMDRIKKSYPPGRQNKLFAIRYGDPEKLKQKSLRDVFKILELDVEPKNFRLVEHLDFYGNPVGNRKATKPNL